MILPGSMNQTWYEVAPSIGFQRTSPGIVGEICSGSVFQRMLKPNGALQGVTPVAVCARTWAYSA